MIIPVSETEASTASAQSPAAAATECWAALSPEAKRERLLSAAGEIFAARGLDSPMSEVSAAAGSGMSSVYRRFPSKHELLAALVTRRLDEIAAAAAEAEAGGGDRWSALKTMLCSLVQGQSADDFMGEARARVADHLDVQEAGDRATAALERLLAAARAEGRLRHDATTLDLKLLFAATRAARRVEPDTWPRMLELMLDALEARPAR
jgi:AcrR family transcriptional regulator